MRQPESVASVIFRAVVGVSFILAGVALFGVQAVWYLRDGFWTGMSVVDVLAYLKNAWAASPTEWIGAHKVLSYVSVPLLSALLGLAIISAE